MRLPGGIATPAGLNRSFSFKSLDGSTELAIVEALEQPIGWSRQVTAVLAAALDTLGGRPATVATVRDMVVGDRQFLLRQLGIRMQGDEVWRSEECEQCGERFDLCLRHSSIPIKEAGPGYPHARVPLGPDKIMTEFRLPTGRDQEALESIGPDDDPRTFLARRLLTSEPADQRDFEAAELSAIEAALEAVAPEVTTEGQTQCPSCGNETRFPLEPGTLLLESTAENLLAEIHRIALAYHWSERDILSLPRSRRLRYLDLIDQSRGLHYSPTASRSSGF